MKYIVDGCNIILDKVSDFNIEEILECGQCFHFKKIDNMEYEVINYGKYLRVSQKDDVVTLYNTSEEDYLNIWSAFFDIERDYGLIKNTLKIIDERLIPSIDAKSGVRILNQDFFETLISFIISQNKQIPHIKQIVHTLSEKYGSKVYVDGKTISLFPTVEQLAVVSEEELRECKVGFRAPYIRDAVLKVQSGIIDEKVLRNLSEKECMERLTSINGVGAKVASCVMLFSLGFRNAFPVDVWMKRIMEDMYLKNDTKKEDIEKYAKNLFGEYSGYAQQYLFYYGRENGIGKK